MRSSLAALLVASCTEGVHVGAVRLASDDLTAASKVARAKGVQVGAVRLASDDLTAASKAARP